MALEEEPTSDQQREADGSPLEQRRLHAAVILRQMLGIGGGTRSTRRHGPAVSSTSRWVGSGRAVR